MRSKSKSVVIVITVLISLLNFVQTDTCHAGQETKYLYWTTGRDIKRSFINGSNVETVVSIGNLGPRGLSFDFSDEMMYWTNAKSIQRSRLDGTALEELVPYTVGSRYSGLTLDAGEGKMYWTDISRGCINRANVNGSNIETIITGLDFQDSISAHIALDSTNDKIYWSETAGPGNGQDMIRSASLDGSNVQTLIDGLSYPWGISLDTASDAMYFISDNTIFHSNLCGTNISPILTGLDLARSIAFDIDAGNMYWSDVGRGGTIFRAGLDGDNIEAIVHNAVPVTVAIVPEPTTILLLGLGGLVLRRRR